MCHTRAKQLSLSISPDTHARARVSRGEFFPSTVFSRVRDKIPSVRTRANARDSYAKQIHGSSARKNNNEKYKKMSSTCLGIGLRVCRHLGCGFSDPCADTTTPT